MFNEHCNYDYALGGAIFKSIKNKIPLFLIDHAHMYDSEDEFEADFYRMFQNNGDIWKCVEFVNKSDRETQWVEISYSDSSRIKKGWKSVEEDWLNNPGSFSLLAEKEVVNFYDYCAVMSTKDMELIVNCHPIRSLKKIKGVEDIAKIIQPYN